MVLTEYVLHQENNVYHFIYIKNHVQLLKHNNDLTPNISTYY